MAYPSIPAVALVLWAAGTQTEAGAHTAPTPWPIKTLCKRYKSLAVGWNHGGGTVHWEGRNGRLAVNSQDLTGAYAGPAIRSLRRLVSNKPIKDLMFVLYCANETDEVAWRCQAGKCDVSLSFKRARRPYRGPFIKQYGCGRCASARRLQRALAAKSISPWQRFANDGAQIVRAMATEMIVVAKRGCAELSCRENVVRTVRTLANTGPLRAQGKWKKRIWETVWGGRLVGWSRSYRRDTNKSLRLSCGLDEDAKPHCFVDLLASGKAELTYQVSIDRSYYLQEMKIKALGGGLMNSEGQLSGDGALLRLTK